MSSLDSANTVNLLPSTTSLTWVQFAAITSAVLYFSGMWACFNTGNPARARREERERNVLEGRYRALFGRREGMVHQAGWAESRGERKEVDAITERILEVDGEIGRAESEIRRLYLRHGVGRRFTEEMSGSKAD